MSIVSNLAFVPNLYVFSRSFVALNACCKRNLSISYSESFWIWIGIERVKRHGKVRLLDWPEKSQDPGCRIGNLLTKHHMRTYYNPTKWQQQSDTKSELYACVGVCVTLPLSHWLWANLFTLLPILLFQHCAHFIIACKNKQIDGNMNGSWNFASDFISGKQIWIITHAMSIFYSVYFLLLIVEKFL